MKTSLLVIFILILAVFSSCSVEKKDVPIVQKNGTKCSPASKKAKFCIELYKPVCGWFNEDIKCVKYPCAQTYSNECFACRDKKVEYWTEGECPK